jgi:outer membrane lipoprotein-sorting protein
LEDGSDAELLKFNYCTKMISGRFKHYIIIGVLFFIGLALYGQDKKATGILNDLQEQTESYENMKAKFEYLMINEEEGINESFEGVLYMKGDAYRLMIAGQIVICDGETIWTYIEDAEEVQINTIEEDDETITPSQLFSSYQENYKSKFQKEIVIDGTIYQLLVLTPNEGKTYSKIELMVDKDKKEIYSFSIFDKSGSTYTYQVEQFTHDIPLEEGMFTFDESDFPDAEIIDMR